MPNRVCWLYSSRCKHRIFRSNLSYWIWHGISSGGISRFNKHLNFCNFYIYWLWIVWWLLSDSLLSILFSTKASFLHDVTSMSVSILWRVRGPAGTTAVLVQRGLRHCTMFFKLLLNGVLCKLYTIGLMHELKVISRIPSWSAGESRVTCELNWSRRNMTLFGIHVKM